jgi:hypothetical protein
MRALIYALDGAPAVGALDLAGRPVLVRQLQWLRDLGIEDVVVEVAMSPAAARLGGLLLSVDPLVARCVTLPTAAPIGVDELADRAGLDDDALFVALPADLLGHARFELPTRTARYRLAPPVFAPHERGVELVFRTRHSSPSGEPTSLPGWGLSVREPSLAHALGCAALLGQAEGLVVHGAEVKPGIWYARGARVAEDATIVPPALIGVGARVFARARLGPNVLVGDGAVIERDAVLSEVSVAPDTLVGEGARIRQAHVDPRGMTSLADGVRAEVDDPLLLAHVHGPSVATGPRAIALIAALLLLGPWLIASLFAALIGRAPVRTLRWEGARLHVGTLGIGLLDLVPALFDVLRGTRDLIGIAPTLAAEARETPPFPEARAGAIDVTAALAPQASRPTLRAMWRWYLRNKRPPLDRALLAAKLRRPRE